MTDGIRPLLVGLGWSPDSTGGLDRYYRDLLTALPEAAGVVIGPAGDAPARVRVESDHSAALPMRLWATARAVSDAARTADVVDAHFALYAAIPVRWGPAARRPLVVHFQGPWAAEASAAGARRGVGAAIRAAVERSVYRRAATVVVLSGAFGRVLIQRYGVSPWRIRVLRPGVDLLRFTPGDRDSARLHLGLPTDRPVVAAVRRLVPRTGVDGLLRAWRELDDGRALLVIAGDGPERDRLEREARALGLAHVRFLGPIADDVLPLVYRAADLSVVPSTALEGFGLVVIESLACGTPVVVTDTGGLPEAVSDLDPGSVVPAGDAVALGQRIADALDGSEPLPDAPRCRAHAERFDWAGVAAEHRRVYADAVSPSTSPRTRVLFVDHCARLSGAEIGLARLLEALPDLDRHVVTFEEGPLLAMLGARGITHEVLAMPARTIDLNRGRVGRRLPWRAVLDSGVQVVRLARRFRRLHPDVVHANSLKACVLGAVAARLARVPLVWHARDVIDDDAYPRSAVRMVRVLAHRLPHAVVANSEATLASLRLPTTGGPHRVVIPDPLPARFVAEVSSPRAVHDVPVVGIVGRLAPWKGQHVFLDAFARAFPDGGTRAVVVGDAEFGEDDYRTALRERSAQQGIADRVTFRGFRHDIATELASLDVLVHASVRPEPFGQVVVEGMAAGLAVVATRAGGPAEIIDDGHDGVLVPPDDVVALADALRALVADPARRRALGAAARVTAARYRADVVAPRVHDVYRVLSGSS